MEEYFAVFANNELFTDYRDQLPPTANWSPSECQRVLNEMLSIVPFGSWLEQVKAGEVTFNAAAAAQCLEALSAPCSEALSAALLDSTCFAFAAPLGGDEQRRVFSRNKGVGEPCRPIADGFGALFFGTCDPTLAFCCVPVEGFEDDCAFPTASDEGICKAASGANEPCSDFDPTVLCRTGLECVNFVCQAPVTTPLSLGDACWDDENFVNLGECRDSYCDIMGSNSCVALKDDSSPCDYGYQCRSGYCDQLACVENQFCTGL
jgi:hypothetical protein